jgi:hypothetical protein
MQSAPGACQLERAQVFPSGPKIAHASEEVLQARGNNLRHGLMGIQNHPLPIFQKPKSFSTELDFMVAKALDMFY